MHEIAKEFNVSKETLREIFESLHKTAKPSSHVRSSTPIQMKQPAALVIMSRCFSHLQKLNFFCCSWNCYCGVRGLCVTDPVNSSQAKAQEVNHILQEAYIQVNNNKSVISSNIITRSTTRTRRVLNSRVISRSRLLIKMKCSCSKLHAISPPLVLVVVVLLGLPWTFIN